MQVATRRCARTWRRPKRSAPCRRKDQLVLERFFDETGGQQLVLHSPFGSRVNRASGLALRKRFCVGFGFELQAAATTTAILISLARRTASRSRRVDVPASEPGHDVLIQALLARADVPGALALERHPLAAGRTRRGGKKVPPPLCASAPTTR
jgi:ATP-dependent Lhr-like helicase